MGRLHYRIANRNYILINQFVANVNKKKVTDAIVKFECIVQGLEMLRGSFWTPTFLSVKILVPEDRIIEYNKINL